MDNTDRKALRTMAARCYKWGANVLAIRPGSKAPLTKWKPLQARRQQLEEAKAQPWKKAGGLGGVCGPGGWRCIDIDDCEVFGPVEKILDALGLPHSYRWVVKTPGGWHIWIRCWGALPPDFLRVKKGESGVRTGEPKEAGAFDHLEVRFERCQTLLPPSLHPSGEAYQFLNGTPKEAPLEVSVERVVEAVQAVCAEPEAEAPAPTPEEAEKPRPKPEPKAGRGEDVERVKEALTAKGSERLIAFAKKHFGHETEEEPNGDVRILGNGGLLLARNELGAWLGSFDRYAQGASDLQFWIEVWDGQQASRDRVTENVTVDRPAVSVTGTIQPGALKEKLTELHFESGFAARFLLCMPPTGALQWTEADVTREVEYAFERLLDGLYSTPQGTDVALTPEAKKLWVGFYNRANEEAAALEGPAKAAYIKGVSYGARLALILHLAEVRGEAAEAVSAESMRRGLHLARWLRDETLRVYELLGLAEETLSPEQRFLRKLPEEFETKEAEALAKEEGIPRSTLFDWLKKLTEAGDLEKVRRGLYRNASSVGLWTNRTNLHKEAAACGANVKESPESPKSNVGNTPEPRHSVSSLKNNGHTETGAEGAGSEGQSANNGSPDLVHNGSTNGAPERNAGSNGRAALDRLNGELRRWERAPGREVAGLKKKQPVRTPKGAGTVVKVEGRTVKVELDSARIGETETFEIEDVEPLDTPF